MKNIILLGTAHAEWIISDLKKIDKNNNYKLIKNIKSLSFIIEFIKADVILFIFAPVSKRQRLLLNMLLFLKKKIVIDWIGTDVLTVLNQEKKDNSVYQKCTNLCEVNWIKTELQSVDIKSEVGPYITRLYHNLQNLELVKPNKKEFVVMSYSGKGREEFYGINKIIKIAEKFPHIIFKIVGTEGKCYNTIPSNVYFLGWISSTKEILEESSLFVRIPKHDGLSLSVLEALYYGKQVAFSFPLDFTYKINNEIDLEACIARLYNQWEHNEDISNTDGKEYVQKMYFDKQNQFLINLKNTLIQ